MKHIIVKGDDYTNERGLFSFVLQYLSNCRYFHSLDENFKINFDLRNKTSYYDDDYKLTNNVWEYYFNPEFDLNDYPDNTTSVIWVGSFNYYGYDFNFENIEERTHCQNIIKTNLKFNDNILNKVNEFYQEFVNKKVLGVHIRGTDITIHHNKFTLDYYIKIIDELISEYDYIFVCTDEYIVINKLLDLYGEKLIHYNSNTLSNDSSLPSFKQEIGNKYKMGEDVIVESLILSKTNFLIKTNSNVSNFSLLMNPNLSFKQIQ